MAQKDDLGPLGSLSGGTSGGRDEVAEPGLLYFGGSAIMMTHERCVLRAGIVWPP